MTKEIGPREKAAQERRVAAYEANQKRIRKLRRMSTADKIECLEAAIATASTKRGKLRKTKK